MHVCGHQDPTGSWPPPPWLMQSFLLLPLCHLPGSSSVLSAHSAKFSSLLRVCKCFPNTNKHHNRRHCTLVQKGHVSSCKEKIRTNPKETSGIGAASQSHWSSSIHPPNKQLFMVQVQQTLQEADSVAI